MTIHALPDTAHQEQTLGPRPSQVARAKHLHAPGALEAGRWRSTDEAAAFLGMPVRVLRDGLTEHARVVGGVIEARWNGIVGRKVGRRWKVWLGDAWTSPEVPKQDAPRAATVQAAESTGHGGKESPHGRA